MCADMRVIDLAIRERRPEHCLLINIMGTGAFHLSDLVCPWPFLTNLERRETIKQFKIFGFYMNSFHVMRIQSMSKLAASFEAVVCS